MQDAPSEVIRTLLVQLGVAVEPLPDATAQAWPAYSGSEPSLPDQVVTVYDTQGRSFGRTMVDGDTLDHYGFQVRMRADSFEVGWQKAQALRDALKGVTLVTVNVSTRSYLVWCISNIGQIIYMGKDAGKTRRVLLTLNAQTSIRPL